MRTLFVTFALIMGILTTEQASAGTMSPVPAARSNVADPAVVLGGTGYPVAVTINRASLFQCPAPHCNQGEASPPHDVNVHCRLDNTFQGWVLVHNRSNGHVGWIDYDWLAPRLGDPRPLPVFELCFGTGTGTRVRNDTVLYQCPGVNCNRGQVATTHDVAVLCQLGVPDTGWRFVVNQSNKHVGFIQSRHLNPDPRSFIC